MQLDTQGSLFGEGGMEPPTRRRAAPEPDAIRQRIAKLLDLLAAARHMPWSERDLRMWQAVLPGWTKWLPADEAAAVRARFQAELQRLRLPHESAH